MARRVGGAGENAPQPRPVAAVAQHEQRLRAVEDRAERRDARLLLRLVLLGDAADVEEEADVRAEDVAEEEEEEKDRHRRDRDGDRLHAEDAVDRHRALKPPPRRQIVKVEERVTPQEEEDGDRQLGRAAQVEVDEERQVLEDARAAPAVAHKEVERLGGHGERVRAARVAPRRLAILGEDAAGTAHQRRQRDPAQHAVGELRARELGHSELVGARRAGVEQRRLFALLARRALADRLLLGEIAVAPRGGGGGDGGVR